MKSPAQIEPSITLPDRFRLDGKRALVTGSSRGIGAALACALAEAGAEVIVHARRESDATSELLAGWEARGWRGQLVTADLEARESAHELAKACGDVDILVLNAAIQNRCAFGDLTATGMAPEVGVNLVRPIELVQRFAPAMQRQGWGRILFIGSVQEVRPRPQLALYAALKNATANLVTNLARMYGPDGITVNNLAPGLIATDRTAAALQNDATRKAFHEAIPLRRIGQPEDCAGAALLLCSEAGAYINGATLRVDGGLGLNG